MRTVKVWHHASDIRIERLEVCGSKITRVYDCEGDTAFEIKGHFDDAEVMAILKVINQAYNAGFEHGEADRARAIAALLNVK
ncbi:TPA: hypothetical protein JG832_002454 [Enterobacter hormaechei subsp. xiangfangensis]|nr:hypothetical protein [Enterobacter hormaechei subsp. xiangfangensis]HAV1890590.1 hypothetical protein [Enterobacter hormaechei subsp. xiangfangensis]